MDCDFAFDLQYNMWAGLKLYMELISSQVNYD